MHSIFVVNPKAGEGKVQQKIIDAIEKENIDAEVYFTKGNLDATEFVKDYIKKHEGQELRFIACGGDGTINEVFAATVFQPDNISVSVYPCGSGNDFVKVFGGMNAFGNIKALTEAEASRIDVMKVSDRYGINVTNFGFDTTVAETVNADRAKKGHGSKSSYAKGVVKALFKSMNNECTVTADGTVLNPEGRMLLCTVANGSYVGGSFKCAPRASVTDGLLEVCLCSVISRIKLVSLLKYYIKGEHLDKPEFTKYMKYTRAKTIHVEAPEGFAYSLDGEIIHENSFTIEIVPHAVNFAYPKGN